MSEVSSPRLLSLVMSRELDRLSLRAGQHLPAASEDHEERRGQDEEPLQLPGTIMFPQKAPKKLCSQINTPCVSQVMEANLSGEMNLKIETDLVSVTTHFKDLGNPPWGENNGRGPFCLHLLTSLHPSLLLSTPPGDDASQDGGPSPSRGPEAMVQARVDIRKLQQFLVGQQVNPSKAMCSKSVNEQVNECLNKALDVSVPHQVSS